MVSTMTSKQFNSEKEYQIRKSIMNKMIEEKIITEQDYKKIDTILLKKHSSFFGSLCG